jgi:hypothetical protein
MRFPAQGALAAMPQHMGVSRRLTGVGSLLFASKLSFDAKSLIRVDGEAEPHRYVLRRRRIVEHSPARLPYPGARGRSALGRDRILSNTS